MLFFKLILLYRYVAAGVITFVGFACLAELSVMDPHAGGIFYYLRTNFGGAVVGAVQVEIQFFPLLRTRQDATSWHI